jgi:hypothetical protein
MCPFAYFFIGRKSKKCSFGKKQKGGIWLENLINGNVFKNAEFY